MRVVPTSLNNESNKLMSGASHYPTCVNRVIYLRTQKPDDIALSA
jgi:hypothetical protein